MIKIGNDMEKKENGLGQRKQRRRAGSWLLGQCWEDAEPPVEWKGMSRWIMQENGQGNAGLFCRALV